MKRFSNSKDMDIKIFNTFIESKLIDNMIQLLSRDNLILIKNLHSFLLSFLDRYFYYKLGKKHLANSLKLIM